MTVVPAVLAHAILGLIIGSFLATLVIRMGDGRSPWGGRSMCDGCRKTLRIRDLVPVMSYALAGGRARCCGAWINPIHPAIELASAAIMVASTVWLGSEWWMGSLFGVLLLVLAALDLRHLWLPDSLTGLLLLTGLAASWFDPVPALSGRMVGIVAGFGSLEMVRIFYRRLRHREGMGAGDPKLLGAIGAWTGWQILPWVVVSAGVAGLIWAAVGTLFGSRIDGSTRLPLGFFLALAAWPIWLVHHIMSGT